MLQELTTDYLLIFILMINCIINSYFAQPFKFRSFWVIQPVKDFLTSYIVINKSIAVWLWNVLKFCMRENFA